MRKLQPVIATILAMAAICSPIDKHAVAHAASPGQGAVQDSASQSGDCRPDGDVTFICDILHAEDLQRIPGSDWVVTSGLDFRGIRLVNARTSRHMQIFPGAAVAIRFDRVRYARCPGPTREKGIDFHGINLREGANGVHTLYAVRHASSEPGSRESVEVFEIDARAKIPQVAWIGCVPAPAGVMLNSVSALPGDGFVSSNFNWPFKGVPADFPGSWQNGQVWEWSSGAEWQVVPGSEFFPGPNGLEASKDGAWLYINLWPAKRVLRLSRGQARVKMDLVEVPFHPDNIHWNADGTLIIAGQGNGDIARIMDCMELPAHFGKACPNITAEVMRLDPETLQATPVVSFPGKIAGASIATVALEVGPEIWISSDWFDRIVRLPRPNSPATPGTP